ncbi:MAG: hypothetical protein QM536_03035 [Chitinophagaceae bacterium]|nr:hypothetical protein [Chitinophagaceae bacterium]
MLFLKKIKNIFIVCTILYNYAPSIFAQPDNRNPYVEIIPVYKNTVKNILNMFIGRASIGYGYIYNTSSILGSSIFLNTSLSFYPKKIIPTEKYIVLQKMRFGIGYGIEYQLFPDQTIKDSEKYTSTLLETKEFYIYSVFNQKLSGVIGYRFYDGSQYSLSLDIEGGAIFTNLSLQENSLSKNISLETDILKKYPTKQHVQVLFHQIGSLNTTFFFFNFGISIERNFSEYFKIFLKPSLEINNVKSGAMAKPLSLTFYIPEYQIIPQIQLGVSFIIPEVDRCPIHSCRVQLKHTHGNYLFRGQPIFKWQNPKIGQNNPVSYPYKIKKNKKK